MTNELNNPAPTQADLLPCPMCGFEVELIQKEQSGLWVFKCPESSPCIGSWIATYAHGDHLEAAISMWNTRTRTPPAQPEAGEPVAETAWLIERHDLATIDSRNEVCLHYYAEFRPGKHYWTPDHMKAKRFPDEAAARLETSGDPLLSVVEHMWHARPTHPITEAAGDALREALKPFADCCEYISDDEDDEEWAKFRLLIKDYRRAREAIATKENG